MQARIKTHLEPKKHQRGIIILLMVALLAQILVACTNANEPDNGKTPVNQFQYVNDSLGYIVFFPESWRDRLIIKENDHNVTVYCKMVAEESEWGGAMLYIYPMSKTEYTSRERLEEYILHESPVAMRILGEAESDYICYSEVSDVNYPHDDPVLSKEYNDLIEEMHQENGGLKFVSKYQELALEKEKIEIMGYIKDFDATNNTITLDEVEWLTVNDAKRVQELGYDVEKDFPNGFMIYNENQAVAEYKVKDNVNFVILKNIGSSHANDTDKAGFLSRIEEWNELIENINTSCDRGGMLVNLSIKDGLVVEVIEQYIP